MNAIEILCQEHTQIEDEIERFLDDFDVYEDVERAEMIYQLSTELINHMNREELFLYRRLKQFKPLQEDMEDSMRDHENIRAMLKILNSGDLDDDTMRETLENLFEFLEHHVMNEEQELFPVIRQYLSIEEIDEMNRNIQERKTYEMTGRQIA